MKTINITNYNTLLFFLIRASFIGICSNNLLTISKQDSLISIIISIVIGLIPLTIYYLINEKYANKKIFEIINITFGKYLGFIINLLITIYITIYSSILFWNLISFISSQYLYKTPEIFIGLIFIIAIIYSLFSNINSIIRSTTILFYIFLFLYIISTIGLLGEIDITNLMPVLEFGFTNVIKGSYNFIALNILPIFIIDIIPHNKIESDKIFKNTIIIYLLSLISILIVNFYTISIYSINFINLIEYPEFHALKRVSLLGFIQRIENILIIQWIFDIFIYISLSCYYIKYSFMHLTKKVKIPKESKNIFYNILIPIIILVISIFIFKNNTISNIFIKKYIIKNNYIIFFIIPLITYITIKLKGAIFKI